ncbi:hypothetical protein [Flavobacterium faecale]|uniref:hypothetical protein n=1 Tax=Flavobacterium faecale TaxID=1355330 RepID=UPI003AAC15B2
MKNIFYTLSLVFIISLVFTSCRKEESKKDIKPSNYIVVLDLSDRILVPEQLDKDFYLIEQYFKIFEKNARRNLVLSSKDRFSVRIIPQNNSPLNINHYEDLLRIYLDETQVKDKNKSLLELSQSLSKVLNGLKKDAYYGKVSSNYFGVDIWAYLHDNGKGLSKPGFENKILVLTDGYFDFESQTHVIKNKNQYTSTRFLNELTTSDWKQIAESKQYGLLPIQLDKNTQWVVAGISGKKANDILQTEKITYFWKKWLTQSGVTSSRFILNGSKTAMSSNLIAQM